MKRQLLRVTPEGGEAALRQALLAAKNQPTDIELAPGPYFLTDALDLSGLCDLRLSGAGARLIGGVPLRQFAPVRDEAVLSRLDEAARAAVVVCDLAAHGVSAPAGLSRRGFGCPAVPSHTALFVGGTAMTLARYPRDGALQISGYETEVRNEADEAVGHHADAFYYRDARPLRWKQTDELWVHGYWSWDWANSYERVAALDAKAGSVQLDGKNNAQFGKFRIGQRFYFLNVLEEVRAPGDYYVDAENALLYFYPPADGGEALLATLGEPMLRLDGCRGITLDGLTLECTRGDGLAGEHIEWLVVEHCTFRNIGGSAAVLRGCQNTALCACTVHDCGDAGFRVFGGDRMTLTPANLRIENNHFYRLGAWTRSYAAPVVAYGVGIAIRRNLIHDCPHCAILWGGNDFCIEQNEIYAVVLESGDAGAIYAGRDVTFRGNSVSGNYIHHLGGVGMGTMGIYNDDVLSGTRMCGNYFFEVGRALMLGGGVDYVADGNVFVKCHPAIHMDSRGAHTEFFWTPLYAQQKALFYDGRQSFLSPNDPDVRLDCSQPPYTERYSELKKLDALFQSGRELTASAEITRNVFCSKPRFRYTIDARDANHIQILDNGTPVVRNPHGDEASPPGLTDRDLSVLFDTRHDINADWSPGKGDWRFAHNYTAAPADFDDADWGIITLRPQSKAFVYGYSPAFAFNEIGLDRAARRTNPASVRTCLRHGFSAPLSLTLGLRNELDTPVTFTMTLHPRRGARAAFDAQPFTLAPHETRFVDAGEILNPDDFLMEAASDCPGVRPARAESILGHWSRF